MYHKLETNLKVEVVTCFNFGISLGLRKIKITVGYIV